MANKNDNDMQRMRQDAIRRSQEMYQRAQTAPPGYSGNAFSETSASPHKPHKPSDKPPAKKSEKPAASKLPSFWDALFADKERNLLLSILLLLMEEKSTDPALLFALLYLLL